MLASSPWLVDGEAIPTTLPNLIMVILSATSLTSLNLWVMKMIDVPFAFKVLIIFKSSSVSCGVSTAVGSSKIKTFAS